MGKGTNDSFEIDSRYEFDAPSYFDFSRLASGGGNGNGNGNSESEFGGYSDQYGDFSDSQQHFNGHADAWFDGREDDEVVQQHVNAQPLLSPRAMEEVRRQRDARLRALQDAEAEARSRAVEANYEADALAKEAEILEDQEAEDEQHEEEYRRSLTSKYASTGRRSSTHSAGGKPRLSASPSHDYVAEEAFAAAEKQAQAFLMSINSQHSKSAGGYEHRPSTSSMPLRQSNSSDAAQQQRRTSGAVKHAQFSSSSAAATHHARDEYDEEEEEEEYQGNTQNLLKAYEADLHGARLRSQQTQPAINRSVATERDQPLVASYSASPFISESDNDRYQEHTDDDADRFPTIEQSHPQHESEREASEVDDDFDESTAFNIAAFQRAAEQIPAEDSQQAVGLHSSGARRVAAAAPPLPREEYPSSSQKQSRTFGATRVGSAARVQRTASARPAQARVVADYDDFDQDDDHEYAERPKVAKSSSLRIQQQQASRATVAGQEPARQRNATLQVEAERRAELEARLEAHRQKKEEMKRRAAAGERARYMGATQNHLTRNPSQASKYSEHHFVRKPVESTDQRILREAQEARMARLNRDDKPARQHIREHTHRSTTTLRPSEGRVIQRKLTRPVSPRFATSNRVELARQRREQEAAEQKQQREAERTRRAEITRQRLREQQQQLADTKPRKLTAPQPFSFNSDTRARIRQTQEREREPEHLHYDFKKGHHGSATKARSAAKTAFGSAAPKSGGAFGMFFHNSPVKKIQSTGLTVPRSPQFASARRARLRESIDKQRQSQQKDFAEFASSSTGGSSSRRSSSASQNLAFGSTVPKKKEERVQPQKPSLTTFQEFSFSTDKRASQRPSLQSSMLGDMSSDSDAYDSSSYGVPAMRRAQTDMGSASSSRSTSRRPSSIKKTRTAPTVPVASSQVRVSTASRKRAFVDMDDADEYDDYQDSGASYAKRGRVNEVAESPLRPASKVAAPVHQVTTYSQSKTDVRSARPEMQSRTFAPAVAPSPKVERPAVVSRTIFDFSAVPSFPGDVAGNLSDDLDGFDELPPTPKRAYQDDDLALSKSKHSKLMNVPAFPEKVAVDFSSQKFQVPSFPEDAATMFSSPQVHKSQKTQSDDSWSVEPSPSSAVTAPISLKALDSAKLLSAALAAASGDGVYVSKSAGVHSPKFFGGKQRKPLQDIANQGF